MLLENVNRKAEAAASAFLLTFFIYALNECVYVPELWHTSRL